MNDDALQSYECDNQMSLEDILKSCKGQKYRNRTAYVDGIRFDSKAEAKRYEELITLQNLGAISGLMRQHPYTLIPGGRWEDGKAYAPVKYIADFVYDQDGKTVVEDVKGYKTQLYMLKKKLMKHVYNIEIREVRR